MVIMGFPFDFSVHRVGNTMNPLLLINQTPIYSNSGWMSSQAFAERGGTRQPAFGCTVKSRLLFANLNPRE